MRLKYYSLDLREIKCSELRKELRLNQIERQ